MAEHALVIPTIGIMQVLHAHDADGPEEILRGLFTTSSPFLALHFTLPDGSGGNLGFFPRMQVANLRAREAMRILTDVHMVLTGPVIFTGVPHHQLGQVVATLSMNDH